MDYIKKKYWIIICLVWSGICLAAEIQLKEISKMEQAINEAKFIKFDQGFFTIIPATFVSNPDTNKEKNRNKEEALFSEIIARQRIGYNQSHRFIGPTYIFYPDIFRLRENNSLDYIGKFKVSDETMKEAIRQKKGVFLPFDCGVIIYWIHEFSNDISLFENKKNSIIHIVQEKKAAVKNLSYNMEFIGK